MLDDKDDDILNDTDEFYPKKLDAIRQYLEEERRRSLMEGIILKGDSFHGYFGR